MPNLRPPSDVERFSRELERLLNPTVTAPANDPAPATGAAPANEWDQAVAAAPPLQEDAIIEDIITTPPGTIDKPKSKRKIPKKPTAKKTPEEPKAPKPPEITADQIKFGTAVLNQMGLLPTAQKTVGKKAGFIGAYIRARLQSKFIDKTFAMPMDTFEQICAQAAIAYEKPKELKPQISTIAELADQIDGLTYYLENDFRRNIEAIVETEEQESDYKQILDYLFNCRTTQSNEQYIRITTLSPIQIPNTEVRLALRVNNFSRGLISPVSSAYNLKELGSRTCTYKLLKPIQIPPFAYILAAMHALRAEKIHGRIPEAEHVIKLLQVISKVAALSSYTFPVHIENYIKEKITGAEPLHLMLITTPKLTPNLSLTL